MADFNVRSDAVNVEQIMEQIRGRIREKRGVDYTEAQIREMASVKLEKFLDPRGVRSDLLEQYRRAQPPYAPPDLPNYAFEADTLFASTRAPLRWIRRLLLPVLKLFFNPNPLIQALNMQSRLNASAAEREAKRDAARYAFDQLHYEVMHNLVVETTRLGIDVKNLKMRIESLTSRLEFNERRARALESVVVYKPAEEDRHVREKDARQVETPAREPRTPPEPRAPQPEPPQADAAAAAPQAPAAGQEGPGQRSRRRRRRRGRRGTGSAAAIMGAPSGEATDADGADDADGPDGDITAVEASGNDERIDEERGADVRTSRPEPFEHTFGALAHPAEPATADPARQPDSARDGGELSPESSAPASGDQTPSSSES